MNSKVVEGKERNVVRPPARCLLEYKAWLVCTDWLAALQARFSKWISPAIRPCLSITPLLLLLLSVNPPFTLQARISTANVWHNGSNSQQMFRSLTKQTVPNNLQKSTNHLQTISKIIKYCSMSEVRIYNVLKFSASNSAVATTNNAELSCK